MRHGSAHQGSQLPSLMLASAGIALAVPLVHDAIDHRIFTSDSIFDCQATLLLAVLGVGMAGVLLWDHLAWLRSRWSRSEKCTPARMLDER